MKHTISVLVENKFGVLARIAGLFSARGYNISSLAVSETHDPDISCMTIVVDARDEKILDQIKKQLNKLIDVITVTDFTKKDHIERELILVKVCVPAKDKAQFELFLKKSLAKIAQRNGTMVIVEGVGDQQHIKGLLEGLEKFGIKELIRTGRIVLA